MAHLYKAGYMDVMSKTITESTLDLPISTSEYVGMVAYCPPPSPPPPACPVSVKQELNSHEYTVVDNRCYFVHKGNMNIDQGRDWCVSHGGELAAIHTEKANEAVLNLLDKKTAWIGALRTNSTHKGEAGTWTWEDGSAWSPITWRTDGLNHNNGRLYETRICIHKDLKWHDWTHGTTPKGVVCQFKGPFGIPTDD